MKTHLQALWIVGGIYEVADARKGTFEGKLLTFDGEFGEIEISSGRAHFMNREDALPGETVRVRRGIAKLYSPPSTKKTGGVKP